MYLIVNFGTFTNVVSPVTPLLYKVPIPLSLITTLPPSNGHILQRVFFVVKASAPKIVPA
jgi:hypothetical protein